ncbi:MAG: TIGR00730 family Rossman fold protein [Pseudomonadales bacterium]|nr:TIGR00730 family Rossman fold protein [Pseudomonadales bacterium]NRA16485.1 TIGR00730 family Rossman fold protein [Oceanospirillaceae bacterium]
MKYAIYCGSSRGSDPVYATAAIDLAEQICRRDHSIVYGGASVGLMGCIADKVLQLGKGVIGVMPKALTDKELQHQGLTELLIVDDMFQRKAKMAQLADAYIAMPGGVGTLEEIFEVWTAGQLGIHQKACAFYNVDGYFDELIEFMTTMVKKGFMQPVYLQKLIVHDDPEQLLDAIAAYRAPKDKWQ